MKLLLYCVKAKPYLFNQNIYEFYESKYITSTHKFHEKQDYLLNGKIVAECDFDVEEIIWNKEIIGFETTTLTEAGLCRRSKLLPIHLSKYLKDKKGYAIHIKNLHIFDKPRELYDCLIHPKIEPKYYGCEHLSKAPQNMMYVELDDIRHILISIRPEWLCKILNGEKTIEIRKKVLREMIK